MGYDTPWWMVVLLAGSGLVPGWAQTASPETAPPAAAPAETPPPGPAASLAPAATDGVLRVTIDVEDTLVAANVGSLTQRLAHHLQGDADDGVIAGGPGGVLPGLEGGEIGHDGTCGDVHGCRSLVTG